MDDGEESGGVEVDVETDGFFGFDCGAGLGGSSPPPKYRLVKSLAAASVAPFTAALVAERPASD